MHRMRSSFAKVGLVLVLTLGSGVPGVAELIQPPGGRAFPDLAGAITGTQDYVYNPLTQTGAFQAANTPFLLTTGPSPAAEAIVQPNADGIRTQVVNLTLDRDGRLVSDPNNSYALYGTVAVGGQTYRGLLLQGTPTAFGAKGGDAAAFNLDMKVTGGALAQAFGPDVYLELHPSLTSRFDGSFAKSFATTIDTSTTLGYHSPAPATVPEPTTLVVLLACGAGLALRRRWPGPAREDLGAADTQVG